MYFAIMFDCFQSTATIFFICNYFNIKYCIRMLLDLSSVLFNYQTEEKCQKGIKQQFKIENFYGNNVHIRESSFFSFVYI